MKKHFREFDQFDGIVVGRLFAPDFAQPVQRDFDFYKTKSVDQIQCAISNISKANNQLELNASIAQANAFVDAAYNLEFINLREKFEWTKKITEAYGAQILEPNHA